MIRTFALLISFVVFASGCATQPAVPLLKVTQSGYAEGVFENATVEEVRGKLIAACVSNGQMVDDSGSSAIVCSKTMTGNAALFTQILIGNSYSTTPEAKTRWVIFKSDNKITVVAQPWVQTQMAMGQVRTQEMNNIDVRNLLQERLFSMGAK